jgi:DNA invertase Pin-like site-specific DNA recombinase
MDPHRRRSALARVQSLTNGIVDTTTAHGKLVFGMFALIADYEAALIRERTTAGLIAARSRGRPGGRKPKMIAELIGKAQRMYNSRQFTMAEIAASCAVTPMTVYRHIRTDQPVDAGRPDRQRPFA